ncbi:MAG: glutathione S-transferase family protein [Gemmobacter sp.]
MILWNYDLDDMCYRVRLMAALAGTPLTIRSVDMFPGREHRGPAMLALNPRGTLPVLQDGAVTLTQPGAILRHVAAATDRGRAFLPDTPAGDEWLWFALTESAVATAARLASVLAAPGDPDALARAARDALRLADDHLTRQGFAGAGFLAGARPTLADVALFPAFALSRDYGVDHDGFPALRAWARRLRALQGFIAMPGIPDYH